MATHVTYRYKKLVKHELQTLQQHGCGYSVIPTATATVTATGGYLSVDKVSSFKGIWGTRTPALACSTGFSYSLSYKITIASCPAGTSTNGWRLVDASTGTVVSSTPVSFGGSSATVTGSFTVPSTGSYYIEIFRNTNNTGACQFRIDDVSIAYSGTVVDTNCSVADGYRFAYNGKESIDELNGSKNVYDYGFRIYDPRIARFLSVDPLFQSYP